MTEKEFDKNFRLDNESIASFLRDIAESVEEDESLKLDGKEWKLVQPITDNEKIMRLIKDENGLEVSFRLDD